MRRVLTALGLWATLALPALATCQGQDLIAALPQAERQALVAGIPYATGNFWQARKGEARLLLIGTYHIADPRFDALAAQLTPTLSAASTLLVEVTPGEEARLQAWLADHPEAVFDQKGPSLRETLGEADWQALSRAALARGTPPVSLLKMRPWLVASLLSVPACMGSDRAVLREGLDRRLIAAAQAQGLALRALEPFDTALKVFDALPDEDELDLIRQALWTEPQAEDMFHTLAEAYFRGESPAFPAFARARAIEDLKMDPAEVDRQLALMFDTLLDGRNAAWIPVIEATAAEGPTIAAFGALHLAGEKGVLNLLAQSGWQLTPWTPGAAWPEAAP